MIRNANEEDYAALAALEAEAFGDSERFCRLVFTQFAGPDNVWLSEEADGIAAMALTVPVTLAGQPGAYLYALTTRSALRGRGYMSALLDHLKAQAPARGWQFFCLVPAGADLASFYAARGFTLPLYRRAYHVPIRRNLLAVAEFDDVNLHTLPPLRDKLCPLPVVTPTTEGLTAVLTDHFSDGGSTARTEKAYGLYRVREGRLCFDEFFAADQAAADYLLAACREKTRCTEARILGADSGLLFYGGGRRLAHGLLCPLTEAPLPKEAYLGLLMDT